VGQPCIVGSSAALCLFVKRLCLAALRGFPGQPGHACITKARRFIQKCINRNPKARTLTTPTVMTPLLFLFGRDLSATSPAQSSVFKLALGLTESSV